MFNFRSFSFTLLFLHGFSTTTSQSILSVTGSQVELTCNYRALSPGYIIWNQKDTLKKTLSQNTVIAVDVPTDLRQRLNITGNHDNGEYNLMITGVKKTDEGQYACYVYGDTINPKQTTKLVVIEGPTSVQILNKQHNRLLGTEGQDLNIGCTANEGDPAPNMTFMVESDVFTGQVTTANNQHTIYHTITRINRSYDGVNVICQAGYDGVTYTPLTDTTVIVLNLKPLPPAFNVNQIVTENTKSLVITCTSIGSRPAPSGRIWLIGNSTIDITLSSTNVSASQQPNDTYIATSTLTYKVPKDYNQQNLTCGFKNTATGKDYVNITQRITVLYAPNVSVQNRTFPLTQAVREVYCNIDGNPYPNSTSMKWQHKSKYGVVIREFDQGSKLILPEQTEDKRYQDTGEYVCITGNGITDADGNLTQSGSGYVVSEAPPMFALYNSWTQGGEINKTVNVSVDVYGVPPPLNFVWYREETQIPSNGYKTSSSQATVKVMFHGKEVEVSGYRSTLTIENVQESDFTSYNITVSNSRGGVTQEIQLKSNNELKWRRPDPQGPPDQPKNLAVIGQTDKSLTVRWEAGYDGGHEQTFYIMYSQRGTGRWTTIMGPKHVRGGTSQIHQTVIRGLQHSTVYEIKMFAQNQIDNSTETMVAIGTTLLQSSGGVTGAITGGVSGGLSAVVIILIVVLVVLKFRKRSSSHAGLKLRNKSASADSTAKKISHIIESDSEDGLKDNPLYMSSGPDITSKPAPVYAEVVKKKNKTPESSKSHNDVYAEVNKQPKKKNKGFKENAKGKGKKIGGIYNSESDYAYYDLPLQKISNDQYVNNEDVHVTSGHQTNADGLKYADLSFVKQPKTGKPVIHGAERTIYSDIDHTKIGPKPPQRIDYEDITIGFIEPNDDLTT